MIGEIWWIFQQPRLTTGGCRDVFQMLWIALSALSMQLHHCIPPHVWKKYKKMRIDWCNQCYGLSLNVSHVAFWINRINPHRKGAHKQRRKTKAERFQSNHQLEVLKKKKTMRSPTVRSFMTQKQCCSCIWWFRVYPFLPKRSVFKALCHPFVLVGWQESSSSRNSTPCIWWLKAL